MVVLQRHPRYFGLLASLPRQISWVGALSKPLNFQSHSQIGLHFALRRDFLEPWLLVLLGRARHLHQLFLDLQIFGRHRALSTGIL